VKPDESLIVLQGLEGHSSAGVLNGCQQMLVPYVDILQALYWGIWCAILAFMVLRHLVWPLWQHHRTGRQP
jgi:hypothetical protein